MAKRNLSPMMQQYMTLKKKHQSELLFFRLGDFYELFFEDAETASRELELTLTGRDCGMEKRAPMCGVPYHAVDTYINRLLEKGFRVAICEQLTDPAESKGIVQRDVVRIITPGTVIESSILDEKANNYLLCMFLSGGMLGFAYADVSTGEFCATEFDYNQSQGLLLDELARLSPSEILVNTEMLMCIEQNDVIKRRIHRAITPYADDHFAADAADDALFAALKGKRHAHCAAQALLRYLQDTQKNELLHIQPAVHYNADQYMIIDAHARGSLELTETLRARTRKGSLLWVMDKTCTAMGARTFRTWLERPLYNERDISRRLDAVADLVAHPITLDAMRAKLKDMRDLERLAGKISYASLNARDCLSIAQSLEVLPGIIELMGQLDAPYLRDILANTDPMDDIYALLGSAIADHPPIGLKEGGIIRPGFNEQLDELRHAYTSAREYILQMESAEREATGIKNLKIGFNKVFGFYIEVTRSNLEMVPYRYTRKQTLANAERYITEELKDLEDKVLHAEERSMKLEYEIFISLRNALEKQVARLLSSARSIAQCDALAALARLALDNNYMRPSINSTGATEIIGGRHPVVEGALSDASFVPNNTVLDTQDNRFLIITGPNMAGKSTYLRQVALITIMAHMGSFVPAVQANIALTDRVFTRVGASDDLYTGNSTFMVEMNEVARILDQATQNSLIILDEIGRGTSTFDGLSIAWAVVEYISNKAHIGAKTLFATHYHELTELEDKLTGVKNYYITVAEVGEDIIFLRKIARGGADKSFGIHVAALAGLPPELLQRAREILQNLEAADINRAMLESNLEDSARLAPQESASQMSLIDVLPYQNVLEEIRATNLDNLTPIEAMYLLNKLKVKMAE